MSLLISSSYFLAATLVLLVVQYTYGSDISGYNITNDIIAEWNAFKHLFNKTYKNAADEENRYAAWLSNYKAVRKHNVAAMHGASTYTLTINQFSDDWYPSEYKSMRGFRSSKSSYTASSRMRTISNANAPVYYNTVPASQLPATVNWIAQGWVNPVQNQVRFLDCTELGQSYPEPGNSDCNGGSLENAFAYVKRNQGINTDSSYPYTGKSGTCQYSSANNVVYNTGWMNVQPYNEIALQQAVALVGPISVGIDASLPSFQAYHRGVYNPKNCPGTPLDIDHAVLVVGYGTTTIGQDYWLIKNSWGTTWGIQGYMMLARNANNMCGVATEASFPTGLVKVGSGVRESLFHLRVDLNKWLHQTVQ